MVRPRVSMGEIAIPLVIGRGCQRFDILAAVRLRHFSVLGGVTAACLWALAAPASAQTSPGVHVDPGSPADSEYNVPIQAARGDFDGPDNPTGQPGSSRPSRSSGSSGSSQSSQSSQSSRSSEAQRAPLRSAPGSPRLAPRLGARRGLARAPRSPMSRGRSRSPRLPGCATWMPTARCPPRLSPVGSWPACCSSRSQSSPSRASRGEPAPDGLNRQPAGPARPPEIPPFGGGPLPASSRCEGNRTRASTPRFTD